MKRINDLDYLKLNKFQSFWYDFKLSLCGIPAAIWSLILKLWLSIKKFGISVWNGILDIAHTFVKGNWAVKLSFLIFGFGNLYYGQILRGLLFLFFEIAFFVYMILPNGGAYWISKVNWFQTGNSVGDVATRVEYEEIIYNGFPMKIETTIWGDDSARVLFYGLISVIVVIAFVVTWRMQVKQCRINMDIVASGKKVKSGKSDLKSLLDDQFHKTLLAPSLVGILLFTVLPIIYMIIVAFTTYGPDFPPNDLFKWVGFDNFKQLLNFGNGGLGNAFSEVLSWTFIWAFFATFSNYFLGMFVALMINKKGIKIKKFWRTVLVMTVAIPQFVSLLYIKQLFDPSGYINKMIISLFDLPNAWSLWNDPVSSKILIILINIWIGIPHIMLMATGILMNIPADLYESAKIDGANSVQQFTKITFPYMIFVTGPYLLTSFVGNLNNFNVIYLLNGGGAQNTELGPINGIYVRYNDLLITWLYNLTMPSGSNPQYYLASIIGILIFAVVAVLSLIIYNVIPSTKNEEDFS